MCDCLSHNAQVGSVPERVLERPAWLPAGERPNGVPVDACIADTIQALWDEGVETLSSCCGHNGVFGPPTLVLADGVDADRVRSTLATLDPRVWRLQQWQLIEVANRHAYTERLLEGYAMGTSWLADIGKNSLAAAAAKFNRQDRNS